MENLLAKLNEDIESFRKSIKDLLETSQLNTREINVRVISALSLFVRKKIKRVFFIYLKELKEALKSLDEAKANKNWAISEIKNVKQDFLLLRG